MRITKYPQSCLIVEVADRRLLIDPGTFLTARFDLDDLGDLDAALITHRHADHIDPALVPALREREVEIVGNVDVGELLGEDVVRVVSDGEHLSVADVDVSAHDLPHVVMVDGSEGPPNTGFVVDGTLFHPGDGLEIGGLTADVVAAPICGPSVSFRDAYAFVQRMRAKTVVPIHYDAFVADPEHFARVADIAEIAVLADGASIEV